MEINGEILNAFTKWKNLHIVWFQLYEILEKAQVWRWPKKISSSQKLEGTEEWTGAVQGTCSALKLFCTTLQW